MINLQHFRRDTPGCNDHIHFNNAGTSLPTLNTLSTTINYLQEEAKIGGYEAMDKYQTQSLKVYDSIAKMINADPSEIAFMQSATDAWYAAFFSIPLNDGDTILCSEAEYGSNFLGLLRRKKIINYNIEIIPSDNFGQLDIQALKKMITKKVKLIAITHVPTSSGLVNPAAEVGEIARNNEILFLLDACQSVGQMPIDVNQLNCDFLSATGRKYIRAPRGTGFLYVNNKVMDKLDPEKIDNWGGIWDSLDGYKLQNGAKRFENFERSYGLQHGLGAAVDYFLKLDQSEIYQYIQKIATYAREGIADISGYEVMDIGKEKCGIVSFKSNERTAQKLCTQLTKDNIASSIIFPSGALIDSKRRQLAELNRVSFHYYNTIDEIDELLKSLKKY